MEVEKEMNRSRREILVKPWGIYSFDRVYKGLPCQTLNLLRANSKDIAYAAVGNFIQAGLDRGERVAIISFDHPDHLMPNFQEHGFSFERELLSEQLYYFYYKSRFSYALSLSTNYQKLFEELLRLGNSEISRIVFLNADVLFNLESQLLARSSAERILASFARRNCVILGCYKSENIPTHNLLDEIGRGSMQSYLELTKGTGNNDWREYLTLHKFPTLLEKATLSLQLSKRNTSSEPVLKLVNDG